MQRGFNIFTGLIAIATVLFTLVAPSIFMASTTNNPGGATQDADWSWSAAENVFRIAGNTRYDTSFAILKECSVANGGLDGVVVMVGDDWKVGASIGALSGILNAPILMVKDEKFSPDTDSKISYIAANIKKGAKSYIIGSNTEVGKLYMDALSKFSDAKLINFSNYNDLSTKVSKEATSKGFILDSVVVATSLTSADAMSALPFIVRHKSLILFTSDGSNNVEPQTLNIINALQPTKLSIVGGFAAVSNEAELAVNRVSKTTAKRMYGTDRYLTNQMIITTLTSDIFYNANPVIISGSFIDGISAGAYAGIFNKFVVEIDGQWGDNSYSQRSFLSYSTHAATGAIFIGGESVIPLTTAEEVNRRVTGNNPYI